MAYVRAAAPMAFDVNDELPPAIPKSYPRPNPTFRDALLERLHEQAHPKTVDRILRRAAFRAALRAAMMVKKKRNDYLRERRVKYLKMKLDMGKDVGWGLPGGI